jgi:hypothetical protein
MRGFWTALGVVVIGAHVATLYFVSMLWLRSGELLGVLAGGFLFYGLTCGMWGVAKGIFADNPPK